MNESDERSLFDRLRDNLRAHANVAAKQAVALGAEALAATMWAREGAGARDGAADRPADAESRHRAVGVAGGGVNGADGTGSRARAREYQRHERERLGAGRPASLTERRSDR